MTTDSIDALAETLVRQVADLVGGYPCAAARALVAGALRGAVGDERERCLRACGDYSAGYEAVRAGEGQSWCPACGAYTRDVADDIAGAIRGGT